MSLHTLFIMVNPCQQINRGPTVDRSVLEPEHLCATGPSEPIISLYTSSVTRETGSKVRPL